MAVPVLRAVNIGCGVGTLTQALVQAGVAVVAAVDSNQAAVQTYQLLTGCPVRCANFADVTAPNLYDWFDLRPTNIDLLVGSISPSWSLHYRRTYHQRKPASLLIAHLLEDLRPSLFVFEYRTSRLDVQAQELIASLKHFLERSRYQMCTVRIDLQAYGVPQHRERIYIMGWLEDVLAPFALPASVTSNVVTVGKAFDGLPRPISTIDEPLSIADDPLHRLIPIPPDSWVFLRRLAPGDRRVGPPLCKGSTRTPLNEEPFAKPPTTTYHRLHPNEPAPLLSARGDQRIVFVHPYEDRLITVREFARLQTFNDSFTCAGPPSKWPWIIAAAIPPQFAMLLGAHIAQHLDNPYNQYDQRLRKMHHVTKSDRSPWQISWQFRFRCFPRPSPSLRILLQSEGQSPQATLSDLRLVEQEQKDGDLWSKPLSYWSQADIYTMLGLLYHDRTGCIRVTPFGQMVARWLVLMNEKNLAVPGRHIALALAACHFPNPTFPDLCPSSSAPLHPIAMIWRAMLALDQTITSNELNHILFHIQTEKELPEAISLIADIRDGRSKYPSSSPVFDGPEALRQIDAWMGLASFGDVLLTQAPGDGASLRYSIRPEMINLLAVALRTPVKLRTWECVAEYATWISQQAHVPEDVR